MDLQKLSNEELRCHLNEVVDQIKSETQYDNITNEIFHRLSRIAALESELVEARGIIEELRENTETHHKLTPVGWCAKGRDEMKLHMDGVGLGGSNYPIYDEDGDRVGNFLTAAGLDNRLEVLVKVMESVSRHDTLTALAHDLAEGLESARIEINQLDYFLQGIFRDVPEVNEKHEYKIGHNLAFKEIRKITKLLARMKAVKG